MVLVHITTQTKSKSSDLFMSMFDCQKNGCLRDESLMALTVLCFCQAIESERVREMLYITGGVTSRCFKNVYFQLKCAAEKSVYWSNEPKISSSL